jgi:NAD(P)-dependent dehydrogenase (short-subunit alcohol dehydrogenase family)
VTTGFSHPHSLADRTAIVTGAAQGVGRGIAAALLSRGAKVLLVDRLEDKLLATSAEFKGAGFTLESLVADLRKPETPHRVVDAAVEAFGQVDALINNAVATNEPKPFADITAEDYDLVFDTAPRATFFLMQAVYPTMAAAGGGVIVNLGSASGTGGQARFGAYAAAKEAVRGMSKAAALEWGRDNVRVNVARDRAGRLRACIAVGATAASGPHQRGRRGRGGLPGKRRGGLSHGSDHQRRRRYGCIPLK